MAPPNLGVSDASLDLQAFNRVVLQIHRAGREVPLDRFQSEALLLVRQVIPFDSAWWGNAAALPMEIHSLHLHNCEQSILEAYAPYIEQDFFRAALIAQPGRTINMADLTTRADFVRSALYRKVGKRYRIEWSLGTLVVEPVSSLQEFLTLWRHDGERPFTEGERVLKQMLMPHLADAHRAARLRELLEGSAMQRACWAVADQRGYLREVSPRFVHWLREHWPGWKGSRLPPALLEHVHDAKPPSGSKLNLQVVAKKDFRFLQVLEANQVNALSPRKREIVIRYARGETYTVIAGALGLAPATVRNHIAQCYRVLGVGNKAELAARVLRAGGQ